MNEPIFYEILKELRIITETLKAMKLQEREYWETWKNKNVRTS